MKEQCQVFERDVRKMCVESTDQFCASTSSEDAVSFVMLLTEFYLKNEFIAPIPFMIFY